MIWAGYAAVAGVGAVLTAMNMHNESMSGPIAMNRIPVIMQTCPVVSYEPQLSDVGPLMSPQKEGQVLSRDDKNTCICKAGAYKHEWSKSISSLSSSQCIVCNSH